MKKWFLTFVIALLVAQISACGKAGEAQQTVPKAEASEDKKEEASLEEEEAAKPEAVGEETAVQQEETAKDTPSAPQEKAPSYYGTWEVKDVMLGDVYALSEDEIKALLNDTLFYSADCFRLNGEERTLSGDEVEEQAYTEETFVQEYGINLGEWWNEKPEVQYFEISSEEHFFGRQFFVADEETLWIPYEGVVFLAKKAE